MQYIDKSQQYVFNDIFYYNTTMKNILQIYKLIKKGTVPSTITKKDF
jgi:hypothetical protein